MDIQAQVNKIMEDHQAVVIANPAIERIEWEIKDIPYRELEAWREQYNNALAPRLAESDYLENSGWMNHFIRIFYRPRGYRSLSIILTSTKVKTKTTVEIIDE